MKKTFILVALAAIVGVQNVDAQTTKKADGVVKVLGGLLNKGSKKSATKTTSTAQKATADSAKAASSTKKSGSTLGTLGNILGSAVGLDKMSERALAGTWSYVSPGVSFTSDNVLAKAGGEVAASELREQLETQYEKVGLTAENTSFTFNEDNTFKAQIAGKPLAGTWSLDENSQTLTLKALFLSLKGYARRTTDGMELTFESKKILSLFQTLTKLSGDQTAAALGDLSKNYDGVRVGFTLKK